MKKLLFTVFLISFLATVFAQTQPGDVVRYTKIDAYTGGLNGVIKSGDRFGSAVCDIGDINGDGVKDLAVGANNHGGYGAVFILFMDTNGVVKSKSVLTHNSNGIGDINVNGGFGEAICSIGDVNSDSIPDIVVSEPNCSDGPALTGAIHIITLNRQGKATSQKKISSTVGYRLGGLPLYSGGYFGTSVDTIGDVNKDGITDLAVGSYLDGQSGVGHGAVWVLLLDSSSHVASFYKIYRGAKNFSPIFQNNSKLGYSVYGIGDFDGDNIPDLIAGAPYYANVLYASGGVFIFHLNMDGSVKSYREIGNSSLLNENPFISCFGTSFAMIPDLYGDGQRDLVIGAERYNNDIGCLFVLNLDTAKNIVSYNKITSPDIPNPSKSRLGMRATYYDDYNGDGYPEIVSSAVLENNNTGAIYIISLKSEFNVAVVANNPTSCKNANGSIKLEVTSSNPSYTYKWNTGATTDSIGGLSAGVYTVTVTNSVGSKQIKSVTLTDSSPSFSVNAGQDLIIPCHVKSVSIGESPDSNYSYQWYPYPGLSDPFIANPEVTPLGDVTYVLTKTHLLTQCTRRDTIRISMPPAPSVNILGDTIVCMGDSIYLRADGAVFYTWSTGMSGASFEELFTSSQYVSVFAIDSNNCSGQDSVWVLVSPLPKPTLGPDVVLNDGDSVVLSPGSFSSYRWNTGQTSSSVVASTDRLSTGTYLYVVEVENEYGCTGSDTVAVFITTGVESIYQNYNLRVYPNPNNGIVNIEWGELLGAKTIRVYDTYGRLVKKEELLKGSKNTKVDLKSLPKGIYYLEIRGLTESARLKVILNN